MVTNLINRLLLFGIPYIWVSAENLPKGCLCIRQWLKVGVAYVGESLVCMRTSYRPNRVQSLRAWRASDAPPGAETVDAPSGVHAERHLAGNLPATWRATHAPTGTQAACHLVPKDAPLGAHPTHHLACKPSTTCAPPGPGA